MNEPYKKGFSEYAQENRGRIVLLLLLFLLSQYMFYTMGISGLALVCFLPVVPIAIYAALKWQMMTFGILFFLNFTIMGIGRYISIPVPVTALSQSITFLALFSALLDNKENNGKSVWNVMYMMLYIWIAYLCLEMLNDTCQLPFSFAQWLQRTYLFGLQIVFGCLVVSLIINKPERVMFFLKFWAVMTIIAAIWSWRQRTFGFDTAENIWLETRGRTTHIIGGTIRYFSFFSDAANFGCHAACAAIVFFIVALTSKIKKHRVFFCIAGVFSLYGMFTTGTRTAVICFILGTFLYIILSKSFKLAIPITAIIGLFIFILAFTKIGQGNDMIRRMRTAFDTNDASKNTRDINQEALKKYMQDAPWGLGISMDPQAIPANNKYKVASTTPPDSYYVYLWQFTGRIGEVLFAIVCIVSLFGGCYIVLFRLKNKSLQGIGAAFCCAFAAINAGGYANNILTQYPNVIVLFGGMALTYSLPAMEAEYIEYEERLFENQEKEKREKEKRKREKRV